MVMRGKPISVSGDQHILSPFCNMYLLCYAFYFGNLAWVKDTVVISAYSVRILRLIPAPPFILSGTYLYDIPLYVVPTSNARTSFLRGPLKAERAGREVIWTG